MPYCVTTVPNQAPSGPIPNHAVIGRPALDPTDSCGNPDSGLIGPNSIFRLARRNARRWEPQKGELAMPQIVKRAVKEDDGLTTAEYAVGTVAVAGLGGILIKLLSSDWAMELIKRVMEWAFSFLFA
jgi:hypothetical protein